MAEYDRMVDSFGNTIGKWMTPSGVTIRKGETMRAEAMRAFIDSEVRRRGDPTVNKMDRRCTACGYTYGSHIGSRCPDGTGTFTLEVDVLREAERMYEQGVISREQLRMFQDACLSGRRPWEVFRDPPEPKPKPKPSKPEPGRFSNLDWDQ